MATVQLESSTTGGAGHLHIAHPMSPFSVPVSALFSAIRFVKAHRACAPTASLTKQPCGRLCGTRRVLPKASAMQDGFSSSQTRYCAWRHVIRLKLWLIRTSENVGESRRNSVFWRRGLICQLWGIHLTGVVLSPRPVLPRALHAWRMPAFPRRLGPLSLGAFRPREVLVAHGFMGDGELQDSVEQHPAAT